MVKENPVKYPRLLVIDATRVSSTSATGQIKKNLLKNWPEEKFMQLYASKLSAYHLAGSFDDPKSDLVFLDKDNLLGEIESFEPEVIYYRPLLDQHLLLHLLAIEMLDNKPVPIVTHIMDDWPTMMAAEDPRLAEIVQQELQGLFAQSHKALSISEKMSSVFKERYGVEFEPISNGIDPALFGSVTPLTDKKAEGQEGLLMRYCGALAKNMTFHTITQIAQAVDSLQEELPVKFEIYTMASWRKPIEEAMKNLRGVSVFNSVSDEDYPRLLVGADVLVLGYNFDADSINYVRYSMANKLPEYLAAGKPMLAVGPSEVAGIEYLSYRKLAHCITNPDLNQIRDAIMYLTKNDNYRKELGEKGQKWAFKNLDINHISKHFQGILCQAAQRGTAPSLSGGHKTFCGINRSVFKLQILKMEYNRANSKIHKLIDRGGNRSKSIKMLKEDLAAIWAKTEQHKKENVHLVSELYQKDYEHNVFKKELELLISWMKSLQSCFKALDASNSWKIGSTLVGLGNRARLKGKPKLIFDRIFGLFKQFNIWRKESGGPIGSKENP